MPSVASKITAKAITGLVLLVPLAILFIAAVEVYDLLENIAAFAALELPFPPIINALIFVLLGALSVFSICYFIGLLIDTRVGQKFAKFVQNGIADKIPLLGLLRNLTMSLTGTGGKELQGAEVNLYGDGTCQLGILMETLPDGRCVIFIPGTPAITLGQTYILPSERVKLLGIPISLIANSLSQWGVGTKDIYKPQQMDIASKTYVE